MKLNAVGVSSRNFEITIKFYTLLGFTFPELTGNEQHIESTNSATKLMIDAEKLMTEIIGEKPQPGNHSSFAVQYDTPEEVNQITLSIQKAGFTIIKKPWNAPWGQRYAIVQDPDGYKIDLYATL